MWLTHACYELSREAGKLLLKNNFHLATAESCTAGLIGGAITAVPGSSAWFKGGIITYSNEAKTTLLGVSKKILAAHGAVSSETVTAMAQGVAQKLNTECAIAVSGIAGPDGGTKEKPVGLVYIGICCKKSVTVHEHYFGGTREDIREQTVYQSLLHLVDTLKQTA